MEEKKNYYIANSPEDNREGTKFSDLLGEALKGWVDPAFFAYKDESGINQVVPYTYHLFDDTSRGLNNVYNVLNDIIIKRAADDCMEKENTGSENGIKKEYIEERKLLLDTIIASKKIYNQYRDDIQKKMFAVGDSCENSTVFLDNAAAIIYREKAVETGIKNTQKQGAYVIADPVERFSLFILIDFTARLLYGIDYYTKMTEVDKNYQILKQKAMQDLFFNPVIAEKVMDVSVKGWKNVKRKDLTIINYEGNALYYLNQMFLLNGDLVLNMAYYKNLPLDRIIRLDIEGKNYTIQLERDVIIAFWRALSTIDESDITKRAANLYSVFRTAFAYIQRRLSSSVAQNVIMELFDKECEDAVERENSDMIESIEEKQRMKRILQNTIAQLLRDEKEDKIREEWELLTDDNLPDEDEEDAEKKINGHVRVEVLKEIHSRGLWNTEVVEGIVIDYIKGEVESLLKEISMGLKENSVFNVLNDEKWKLNTKNVVDSWNTFNGSKDGVSKTKAKETKKKIAKVLGKDTFENGISFENYNKVCQELWELAGNGRVRYGRFEAQNMLNAMQEAFAVAEEDDEWTRQSPYFTFLLQCLYKYKTSSVTVNNMVEGARLLAEINKILIAANERADKNAIMDFITTLNENLVDKVDADYFETLFS